MESIFGMENMAKEAATARLIKSYEREIRDVARVFTMLQQATPVRPAWYCPLLVHVGEALVSSGTRLKARYSIQAAPRTR